MNESIDYVDRHGSKIDVRDQINMSTGLRYDINYMLVYFNKDCGIYFWYDIEGPALFIDFE